MAPWREGRWGMHAFPNEYHDDSRSLGIDTYYRRVDAFGTGNGEGGREGVREIINISINHYLPLNHHSSFFGLFFPSHAGRTQSLTRPSLSLLQLVHSSLELALEVLFLSCDTITTKSSNGSNVVTIVIL
eukprot:GHVU01072180.1.p1 GENE.GHVU01072180.1~~GHVU01072180.1.p1  ORF type:complete len:130 (+),score=2.79 GHVU01072180.1:524-913(+)